MGTSNYSDEFKRDAVYRITESSQLGTFCELMASQR